jgi:hypothetical protein
VRSWFALALVGVSTSTALSQFVQVGGPGSTSVTFDSLAGTGNNHSWQNGATITGAYSFRSNGNQAITTYDTSAGSDSNAGLYSFGSNGSSERALGAISGGNVADIAFGIGVQNTSASPLILSIAYTGEQWRNSGTAAQHTLQFSYQTFTTPPSGVLDWDPTQVTPPGYTDLDALDFTGPIAGGSQGELDGNAPANQIVFGSTNVLVLDPGAYAIFRWHHLNNPDADHGLAIDSVMIGAAPVPEPAGLLLVPAAVGLLALARQRRAAAVATTGS